MQQLDIFEHSRDVVLRNGIAQAIARCDPAAGRAEREQLAAEFPHDEILSASLALIETLERGDVAPLADHDALREARLDLEQRIVPAALRVLGESDSRAWLARRWQDLARRACPLPYDGACADDHAAALWLRVPDWTAAEHAVTTIASWRRIPAPLAWMVEARLHVVGLQATWPLLAELAWLAPARLADVARRSQEAQLVRFVGDFERDFDGEGDARDLAWFPAWVLTRRPALREHLAAAQPSLHTAAEQALRVMVELLGLEHQGRQHDIVIRRRTLRELHPALFAAYMQTR